jgi:tryptophan-rich sensory protein
MMFLSGMAAGITVNEIKSGKLTLKKEREAYRGGLYFISMFFLSLIHYPLFFACERILISLIISIITVVCATLCAIMWSGISSVACVMMSANAFFSVYIAFINLNILAIN